MLANTLLSGSVKTADPIAVLVDLAARGYLSITPLSRQDWRLVALRGPDDGLRPEDRIVLGAVFGAYGATKPAPRTPEGEVARTRLLAFKRMLAGIDPTVLPPEKREATLAGLLPYAVALGLAPQLAAAFSAAGVVADGHVYSTYPLWWSTFAGDATRATSPSRRPPAGRPVAAAASPAARPAAAGEAAAGAGERVICADRG